MHAAEGNSMHSRGSASRTYRTRLHSLSFTWYIIGYGVKKGFQKCSVDVSILLMMGFQRRGVIFGSLKYVCLKITRSQWKAVLHRHLIAFFGHPPLWTPCCVRVITISAHTWLWKRRLIPGTKTCRPWIKNDGQRPSRWGHGWMSPTWTPVSNRRPARPSTLIEGARALSRETLRPSLPYIIRGTNARLSGGPL